MLKSYAVEYLKQDEGAITVDWVVLCAAVIGLGLAVVTTISGGAVSYAEFINEDVTDIALGIGGSD